MRKLTAILVALGFLTATSLPTIAATASNGVTTLSAQAQQTDTSKPAKKAKKTAKKKAKKVVKKAAKKAKKTKKKMDDKKTDDKKS